MGRNRTLSSLVACLYVGAALFALPSNPSKDAVPTLLMACLFVGAALATIRYGEEWGGACVGVSAPGIDRGTPGCFVVLCGRLLLLLPVVGRHCLPVRPLKKRGCLSPRTCVASQMSPDGCPRRSIASAAATSELN